jgi:hypothetical protein
MSVKDVLTNFFKSIGSKFDLENGWLPFINSNIKWSVSLCGRVIAGAMTLFVLVQIVKCTGVLKDLKSVVNQDILGITPKGTTVISYPNINYEKDIKTIEDLLKILKQKKAEGDVKKKNLLKKVSTDKTN